MSLARRLMMQIGLAAAAVGLLAAVAALGLGRLEQRLDAALGEYATLRQVYEQGVTLVRVRERLAVRGDRAEAAVTVGGMLALLAADDRSAPPDVLAALEDALATLGSPQADDAAAMAALNRALNAVAASAGSVRQEIAALQQAAQADQQRALQRIVVAAVALLVIVAAGGAWQYRRVLGPVRQLQVMAQRLAGGERTVRVATAMDRELADLAGSFNTMAAELSAVHAGLEQQVRARSAALVEAERLAAVGMLAAGVAHEVNNPLGVIAGEAELALREDERGGGGPAAARRFRAIRDEAFRCKAVTERLLDLARPASGRREPVDVATLARDCVAVLHGESQRREVTLNLEQTGGDVRVAGDPQQLRQVIVNLLLNAIASAPPGSGRVTLRVERREGAVRLAVMDNGRGMDKAMLDRLFEPLLTERPADEHAAARPGHGLGLWVSRLIVRDHGGTIAATSDGPGRGSRFVVALPALAAGGGA